LSEINPLIGTAEDPENWAVLHKEVVERCVTVAFNPYILATPNYSDRSDARFGGTFVDAM
jgi:hypothetical protein